MAAVEGPGVSRRDFYHDAVKQALIKDGRVVTHDPYLLVLGRRDLYVDLAAEGPLAAEKAGRRIAVEVKSFLGTSEVTELERALGQYALYRALLQQQDPQRDLFLAVPTRVQEGLLVERDVVMVLEAEVVRLIVFNPEREMIVSWLEWPSTGKA